MNAPRVFIGSLRKVRDALNNSQRNKKTEFWLVQGKTSGEKQCGQNWWLDCELTELESGTERNRVAGITQFDQRQNKQTESKSVHIDIVYKKNNSKHYFYIEMKD